MGYKANAEKALFDLYRWMRKVSGQKKRIKEFSAKQISGSLTKEQEQQIREFYAPYEVPNMVFHKYFTSVSGKFYPEYIPQDLYIAYIDSHFNDIIAAKYYENKCNYGALFTGIRQPATVLKRVNNIWMDGACNPVLPENMDDLLKRNASGVFVKEAQVSAGGHGVTYLSDTDATAEQILEIAKKIPTDIIVQAEIRQHEAMAKLNPSSVNSLRIYSVLHKNGEVIVYSAVVRMGVGDNKIDNYSAGGMTCGITEDGHLRKYGYNRLMDQYTEHPTSNISFEGYTIPNYQQAIELVKKSHPMVAHFRSIDWDIAIGEDGDPILIEANMCRGGIDSLQVNNGPLYGKDTKKILDEVFGK